MTHRRVDEARLYVIELAPDRVKVGYSSQDPARRFAQHRSIALAHGGAPGREWTSAPGTGSWERETALIAVCSRRATARFRREYFAGVSFDDVVQWATDVINAPDLSVFGDAVVNPLFAMELAPGCRITGIRPKNFDFARRISNLASLSSLATAMELPEEHIDRVLTGAAPVDDQFFSGAQRAFPRLRPDDIFVVVPFALQAVSA
jgi:hypothetical protein